MKYVKISLISLIILIGVIFIFTRFKKDKPLPLGNAEWQVTKVISDATAHVYAGLPKEVKEVIKNKANRWGNENSLTVCKEGWSRYNKKDCDSYSLEDLHYIKVFVDYRYLALWNNANSCYGRCSDKRLQKLVADEMARASKSPFSHYGKYHNRWLVVSNGKTMEGRDKFGGEQILHIDRSEDKDEIWLFPFTYIPDRIGIELYENLADKDEILEPYFIDIQPYSV